MIVPSKTVRTGDQIPSGSSSSVVDNTSGKCQGREWRRRSCSSKAYTRLANGILPMGFREFPVGGDTRDRSKARTTRHALEDGKMPSLSLTTVLTIAVSGETFSSTSFLFNLKLLKSFRQHEMIWSATAGKVESAHSFRFLAMTGRWAGEADPRYDFASYVARPRSRDKGKAVHCSSKACECAAGLLEVEVCMRARWYCLWSLCIAMRDFSCRNRIRRAYIWWGPLLVSRQLCSA